MHGLALLWIVPTQWGMSQDDTRWRGFLSQRRTTREGTNTKANSSSFQPLRNPERYSLYCLSYGAVPHWDHHVTKSVGKPPGRHRVWTTMMTRTGERRYMVTTQTIKTHVSVSRVRCLTAQSVAVMALPSNSNSP
eukprot:scaffold14635_cov201-Amphora_coffeaeformis.AAC.11